jgi:Bacterial Ig domain
MLEAKRLSKSSRRSAWSYATILGAAALSACVFFDPKGGNDGKNANAVPLFNEQVPLPETATWPAESGIEFSALGNLNPVFFDAAKSPLRSQGARIKFNLFEGVNLYAVVDRVTGSGPNHIVTKGRIEGIEDGTFLISTYNGLLSGVVRAAEAGNFNVSFTKDGNYRVSKLNDYDFNFVDAEVVGESDPVDMVVLAAKSAALRKQSGAVRVDVAFLYDSAVANSLGHDSIRAKIAAAVDEANDVFENSGIDLALNIVDTTVVNVIVSDTADSALTRIKRDTTSGTHKIAHTIRAATGADIVIWVANDLGAASGATTTLLNTGVATGAANAFIVMTPDALDLGEYGVTILVGKNMGAATDAKSGKKQKGYDKYSRGFVFKGKDKISYRTVEAGVTTATIIPYFSNPAIKHQQKAIGTKAADNAKTLRITGPIVAAYEGSDEEAVVSISFPATGSSFGGSKLKIVADVEDDAGKDTVNFYSVFSGDTTLLGTDTIAPFALYSDTSLAAGSHSIFVQVKDAGGNTTNSEAVTVTMGALNGPSGFKEEYLGTGGYNGSIEETDEDEYTITTTSSGSGTNDDVQFFYKEMLAGRVSATFTADTSSGDSLARFGLMVRDSLHRAGPMAFLSLGNDATVKITTRVKAGKAAVSKVLKSNVSTASFMMARNSNFAFIYWDSTGASNWTYLSKVNFGAKLDGYIGFAATSGDSTNETSTEVANVDFDSTGNAPPTVSKVTGITANQAITGTDSLTIGATLSDPNGAAEIEVMKIYGYRADSTFLLGQDSVKPFSKKFLPKVGITKIIVFGYDATDSTGISFTCVPSNGRPVLALGSTDTVTVHLTSGDTLISNALATDGGTLTYSKTGGADSALFTLNSSTGKLHFNIDPLIDSAQDADSNHIYVVTYGVTDGTFSLSQTILAHIHRELVLVSYDSVINIDDTIPENTTAVATVEADGDTVRYYLSGISSDEAFFTVDSITGVLSFKAAPDYENPKDVFTDTGDNIYHVLVDAYDIVGNVVSQDFTISVSNVADAFVDTVTATKDAWGQGGDSIAVNHGTSSALYVRTAGADTTNHFRSVMTFSLASLDTISAATLRLFGASSSYDDTIKVVVLEFDSTGYTESGMGSIVYEDLVDSLLGDPIDTLNVIRTSNQFYTVDVGTVVNAAKNDSATAISFALVALDSTVNRAVFYSKEASATYGPQLILTGEK